MRSSTLLGESIRPPEKPPGSKNIKPRPGKRHIVRKGSTPSPKQRRL